MGSPAPDIPDGNRIALIGFLGGDFEKKVSSATNIAVFSSPPNNPGRMTTTNGIPDRMASIRSYMELTGFSREFSMKPVLLEIGLWATLELLSNVMPWESTAQSCGIG